MSMQVRTDSMPLEASAQAKPHAVATRSRLALLWVAATLSWGMLLFTYRHLEDLATGRSDPAIRPFINEMTGAFAGWTLFFGVLWVSRRYPLTRDRWLGRLPIYALALIIFAAGCTSVMWALRELLYPLAGQGNYDYGRMPLRYFMELPMQVIGFVMMVAGIHSVRMYTEAREREVRAAKLESALARTQLRNLRLQLQPHFLFNALNTISSTMYDDPAAADEMLDQLAELLRASLRTTQTDEVPLRVEMELLDRYLNIMRARFGDRLRVDARVEPGTGEVLVPSMIMQPLVENAIRHGNATLAGSGEVDIRVTREGGRIVIEVEDDGPGPRHGADAPLSNEGGGIGLTATAERLQLLYGAEQSFETGVGAQGGFLVRVSLPGRTAGSVVA
ncbi:MAG: histidine kinase [Acidobacteriota bacterium]